VPSEKISGGTPMTTPFTNNQQITRDVYYSIGIDQTKNPKEKITDLYGVDSQVTKVVDELNDYVNDPQTRKSPWFWNFYKRVKSAMSILYPHTNNAAIARMTGLFIDDIFAGGYIRALQSLSVESGDKHTSFVRDYANYYAAPIGAALLFGPNGGAYTELVHFIRAEKLHGIHRPGFSPDRGLSEQTRKTWYAAEKIGNWPTVVNNDYQEVPIDVAEKDSHLESVCDRLSELWRRNPTLRNYTGSNRLSGDIPFQIIEDVVDMLIQKEFSIIDEIDKARYNQIIEQANKEGIDPFYAVYKNLFPADQDRLQPLWDKARQWLYDHSLQLWESQNQLWLAEGKRTAAGGVSFYKAKKCNIAKKKHKYGVPGTIYLNNGRYYWVVAKKMKPRPLIDPKSRPKVPGTIFKDGSRYYWVIPGLLKRQRLVLKGQRYSTQDKTTAERIAIRIWNELKRQDPFLASTIIKRTRSQGLATKDKAIAIKVACKLWRKIQEQDPELAAKIQKDNHPEAKDHWQARIHANGEYRHIGTYRNSQEAQAAYIREFEKTWGYAPGYNVQCIPKIDKVWPTWQEEKARLEKMHQYPRVPVIGQSDQTEALLPMIERMQRVNWLTRNVILFFDENSPCVSEDIAIQSRGKRWYEDIIRQGKRAVVCGSASIDKDTGQIRITIYNQGFTDSRVLAEELYHIAFKVIKHSRQENLEQIRRWYQCQLIKGADPTFLMPDMFCSNMALQESGVKTTLPNYVVKPARDIFSDRSSIPDCVMEKVKANWSIP
jgi:hypothetical protein